MNAHEPLRTAYFLPHREDGNGGKLRVMFGLRWLIQSMSRGE
jgi:hypothetical protein